MKWKSLKQRVTVIEELSRTLEYDFQRDGFTQSMLSKLDRCWRLIYLSLRKWESIEKNLSFANGTITHEILDQVYNYYKDNKKLPTNFHIKLWINKFAKENIVDWLGVHAEKAEFYKTVCFVIVTEYIEFYKDEFKKIKILSTEEVFNINYQGTHLRGKKDLKFINLSGNLIIGETKTMARISEENLLLKLVFDVQSLFYMNSELLSGQKCYTVRYNIVRNPGHVQSSGESLQVFKNRLRKNIQKKPEHFFKRISTNFTEEDIKQFRIELNTKINIMNKLCSGELYPIKNEQNCINPFKCPFLKACSSGSLKGYTRTKILFKELL